MSDQDGAVEMLTLVTPLRPFTTWWLRLWFAISRLSPRVMAIGKLREVQFTHWSIVTAFPYNGEPQTPEAPERAQLVWSTVWTGRMDPYVEAFVRGVAKRINLIWGTSYGYPRTKSVSALKRYIVDNATPGSFTYAANPGATARTVDSARRIEQSHALLLAAARSWMPADFRAAYDRFLVERQADL